MYIRVCSSAGHVLPLQSDRHNRLWPMLLSTVLCTLIAISPASADELEQEPETVLDLIDRSEQNLTELQQELGNFDLGTLSALADLTELYLDTGNLARAESTLSNRLEILRMNLGLHSAEQIPVLEAQMRLRAARSDLEAVADSIAHLAWLYQRNEDMDGGTRLQGLEELQSWTLALLGLDSRDREATHILQYRDLAERLGDTVEDVFSEDDPQYLAYRYRAGKADALLALSIIHNPLTGQELISRMEGLHGSARPPGGTIRSVADLEAAYGPRVNTVWERSFRNHMLRHFQKLEDLRDLATEREDQESAAMLELYLGDSVLLRQQMELRPGTAAGPSRGRASTGSASRYYARAWEQLLTIGHDEAELEDRLACPALLPVNELYTRLDEHPSCSLDGDTITLPAARLLQSGIPELHSRAGQLWATEDEERATALLQFRVLRNGQVSAPQILSANPDTTGNRARLLREIRALQFRPALEDGSPVVAESVTMSLTQY